MDNYMCNLTKIRLLCGSRGTEAERAWAKFEGHFGAEGAENAAEWLVHANAGK